MKAAYHHVRQAVALCPVADALSAQAVLAAPPLIDLARQSGGLPESLDAVHVLLHRQHGRRGESERPVNALDHGEDGAHLLLQLIDLLGLTRHLLLQ